MYSDDSTNITGQSFSSCRGRQILVSSQINNIISILFVQLLSLFEFVRLRSAKNNFFGLEPFRQSFFLYFMYLIQVKPLRFSRNKDVFLGKFRLLAIHIRIYCKILLSEFYVEKHDTFWCGTIRFLFGISASDFVYFVTVFNY